MNDRSYLHTFNVLLLIYHSYIYLLIDDKRQCSLFCIVEMIVS